MTTMIGNEDPFDEVERGIDWLERLESIKARQDKEAAIRETVEYVNRLRSAIAALSSAGDLDIDLQRIAESHGQEIADLIQGIGNGGPDDPWTEYLRPALEGQ